MTELKTKFIRDAGIIHVDLGQIKETLAVIADGIISDEAISCLELEFVNESLHAVGLELLIGNNPGYAS